MTKIARIAKHIYRHKHTTVTTYKNDKSKVIRKERTRTKGSPSMKEWAATCAEGRAWLENKKQV